MGKIYSIFVGLVQDFVTILSSLTLGSEAIIFSVEQPIAFFQQEAPHLQILSTLEVVKHWSEEANINLAEVRIALKAIRVKGRYIPRRNHPLLSWWKGIVPNNVLRIFSSDTRNIPEKAPIFRSNSAFFSMNDKIGDTSLAVALLIIIDKFSG